MSEPLTFLPIEVKSYLPSGWGLIDEHGGRWDARRRAWSTEVYDLADNNWTIEVSAVDADKLGRLAALKLAVDELYREALG